MKYARAVVLLTGATGFVGKAVLAELLRQRKALGWSRVYVLVRAADQKAAEARVKNVVLASAGLGAVPPEFTQWVQAIRGDILEPGLGLACESQLLNEVTHVIHCAASVGFSLPIADAAAVNVAGTLHVLEWARACPKLASLLLVSTAYVSPYPPSSECSVLRVEESLAPLTFDAEALYLRILSHSVNPAWLLTITRHPNTYTLTKCLAEHLVVARARGVPVTILRPSIVSASVVRPYPGWIDSAGAFAGFVMMIGTGRLNVVAGDLRARLDLVPCDEVALHVVEATFMPPSVGDVRIRHSVAGIASTCSVELCRERILRHFNRAGKKTASVAYVGPRGARFHFADVVHHELPRVVATLNRWLRLDGRVGDLARSRQRRRTLNREFSYFTHATFDFRTSRPMSSPLDPSQYLDTVCEGVERHLLRPSRRR